jgi:hypothetical protein
VHSVLATRPYSFGADFFIVSCSRTGPRAQAPKLDSLCWPGVRSRGWQCLTGSILFAVWFASARFLARVPISPEAPHTIAATSVLVLVWRAGLHHPRFCSTRFCCHVRMSFVCGLLQVEAGPVLDPLVQRLEFFLFLLSSHGCFSSMPTRCSMKYL